MHGASRDALAYVRRVLEIEINSVTDNPIVFAEDHRVVSGGNFHGQPVAIALDLATIAVAELADISDARVDRMTNGHTSGLPPFLTRNPGTNSGFMVAQYTSAALVTENRLRAFPASVESVPTSAGMEDHVSMGVHAAHKLADVVRNTAGAGDERCASRRVWTCSTPSGSRGEGRAASCGSDRRAGRRPRLSGDIAAIRTRCSEVSSPPYGYGSGAP